MSTKPIRCALRWIRRWSIVPALLSSAVLVVPAQALAGTPTGEFATFADCPLAAPALAGCVAGQTVGGQLTIGHVSIPITKPVILQGGLTEEEATETLAFVGAADGHTLISPELEVPGGLLGDGHRDGDRLPQRLNQLTITLELAGPVQFNVVNLFSVQGPGLVLPIKLKLTNALLDRRCYIGSNEAPIDFNLTDGVTSPPPPNQPIAGNPGTSYALAEGAILAISGSSLVDNAFAVPSAHECGWFTHLVNQRFNLPSPAGSNSSVLELTQELAGAESVLSSEKQQ